MHIRALSASMHHFDSLCTEMCGFSCRIQKPTTPLVFQPGHPPRTASWQQLLNLTGPARTYSYHAGIFPFSDYGHTFSSQSGICKGNYTSHQDEILPEKEVKTRAAEGSMVPPPQLTASRLSPQCLLHGLRNTPGHRASLT